MEGNKQMSVTLENLIIVKLIKFLNDNRAAIGLPVDVYNNEHGATGAALWVQPNSGTRKAQAYVGGSFRGSFPFTLCHQMTSPEQGDGRRAALDLPFYALAEWLHARKNTVTLDAEVGEVTIDMQSNPSISYISEDGRTVEHGAVFILQYKGGLT